MAAPARTPVEVAQLIHNNTTGTTVAGWTLVSKTVLGSSGAHIVMQAVVSRGAATWTGVYTTQSDGTLGKVYFLVDDDGRRWNAEVTAGTWTDRGIV